MTSDNRSRGGLRYGGLAFLSVLALVAAAGCGGGANPMRGGPECTAASDCTDGICVSGRCVPNSVACDDPDGDGAGVGPGCTAYDCNEGDPTIPMDHEVCGNLVDDNCNGSIDEGCPCVDSAGNPVDDGTTMNCGMGLGDCVGTQTCTGGTWQPCTARPPSASETCFNGIDDNCDGHFSEGCCPTSEHLCPNDTAPTMCSSNGTCT